MSKLALKNAIERNYKVASALNKTDIKRLAEDGARLLLGGDAPATLAKWDEEPVAFDDAERIWMELETQRSQAL